MSGIVSVWSSNALSVFVFGKQNYGTVWKGVLVAMSNLVYSC